MPFERIDGRSIYYEEHGAGPTLLLLHHGFAASAMWKNIYPAFVEAGYRVIMYDRRGYGKSEPGHDFDGFYVSDRFCAESVDDLAALSEKLQFGAFHILGQCEGGVIGLIYAGRFKEKVRSIALGSTLCHSDTTMREFNRVKFPRSFQELDEPMREKILEWHGADRAEKLYEMARTRGGAYGSEFFDLRPMLPAISAPSLILYPDRSALFEVEQAVAFYRGLVRGELAIIPRCGHNSYDHKPGEYIRLVLDFLKRVEERPDIQEEDFSMTCAASSVGHPKAGQE